MTDTQQPIKIEKKAYTKPALTEVRLVAQEAVLAVCKDNIAFSLCGEDLSCSSTPRS
jgi:hypothetical protein